MIVFLRSADAKFDSRLQKYIKVLEGNDVDFHILDWPRNRLAENTEHITHCPVQASFGGKLKNLFGYIKWFKFLFSFLCENRKKITKIHAVDFDTGVVSFFIKLFLKTPYIYDIYDHYADSRSLSGLPWMLIDKFERVIAKNAESVILVDEQRKHQHQFCSLIPITIIENVPSTFKANMPCKSVTNNNSLTISYVGVLEETHRGLENILRAAKDHKIELHIAGFGGCEKSFKEASFDNVHFYGSVGHDKAMEIMAKSDIILGLYYLSNPNHKYASPNKYYEHLALGKPLLTSDGTPPGEKVKADNSGWSISDSYEDLSDLISLLVEDSSRASIIEKGKNAEKRWSEEYKDYFDVVLKPSYLRLINK